MVDSTGCIGRLVYVLGRNVGLIGWHPLSRTSPWECTDRLASALPSPPAPCPFSGFTTDRLASALG